MNKAIPLITVDDNGVFSVCEESLDIIASITEPIAIASVVGQYRTGKSFLLNQLLEEKTSGFDVGPTIQPCTKGIWMWGSPITLSNKKCQNFKLLLIDTEGISSFTENETHDAQVFALGVLLSSFFIYNSLGTIDENAISRLSLVTEVTKIIKAHSDDEGSTEDIFEYFPTFLWVVRDFVLQLKKDGEQVSPKQYLEMALEQQKGESDHVKAKNRVRQSIKGCFPKRDCFTLVRPVTEERQFHNISELNPQELRPQFRKQISQLKEYLFSTVSPKKMNGHYLTGQMLAPLTKAYVRAINQGVVVISSAWDNLVQVQCERAFTKALTEFQANLEALSKRSVLENFEFEAQTKEFEALAWKTFNKEAIGEEERVHYEDQLKDAMHELYGKYREKLRRTSNKLCVQTLNELFLPIDKRIHAPSSNYPQYTEFSEYIQDWEKVLQDYSARSKGPEKANVMLSAVQRWFFPSSLEVHQKIASEQKKALEMKYKPIIQELEQQQRLESEKFRQQIMQLESQENELEENLLNERNKSSKLEQEKADLKRKLDSAEETKESLQTEIQTVQSELQETEYKTSLLNQEKETLQFSLEDLQNQKQRWYKEKNDLKHNLKKTSEVVDDLEKTNRQLEETIKEMEQSKAYVEEALQESRLRNSQLLETLNKERTDNNNNAKTISEQKRHLSSLESEMESQQKLISKLQDEMASAQENLKCSSLENDSISQAFRVVKFEKLKLSDSITDYQKEIASLQSEISHLKKQLETSEKDAHTDKKHWESRVKELERELKESNYKLKAKTVEIESLKTHQETDLASIRNSLRESSLLRASKLEKQVEDLNLTNRRVLKINRKVMEENEKMRHKMLKLLNEFKLDPSVWVNDLASVSSSSSKRKIHRMEDTPSLGGRPSYEAGTPRSEEKTSQKMGKETLELSPVLPVNEPGERARSSTSLFFQDSEASPVKQSLHFSNDRKHLKEQQQNGNNYRYGTSRLLFSKDDSERDTFVDNWLSRSLTK